VLASNQLPVPLQERPRAHQGGQPLEPAGIDLAGLGWQPTALVIVEAGFLAQLFSEDPDLLLEVFNDVLLGAVEPPSQAEKQELKRVQGQRMQRSASAGHPPAVSQPFSREREFSHTTASPSQLVPQWTPGLAGPAWAHRSAKWDNRRAKW